MEKKEQPDRVEEKKESHKKKLKKESEKNQKNLVPAVILAVLVFIGIGIALLVTQCRIETMKVKGNVHYSDKQVRKMVKSGHYIDNSLLLVAKNKIWPVKKQPFIEKITIHFDNWNQVTIQVKEKQLAASVADKDRYVYFDNDGVVTDCETRYLSDIPMVLGLEYEEYSIHKKLPVTDEKKFNIVLDITRCMEQTGMKIQQIVLTEKNEIYLYYEKVCVQMGTSRNLDMKLANLPDMMAKADGLDGTLHMENYSQQNRIVSFIKEEKPDLEQ